MIIDTNKISKKIKSTLTSTFEKSFETLEKAFEEMEEAFEGMFDAADDNDAKVEVKDGHISITGKFKSLKINGKEVLFKTKTTPK